MRAMVKTDHRFMEVYQEFDEAGAAAQEILSEDLFYQFDPCPGFIIFYNIFSLISEFK